MCQYFITRMTRNQPKQAEASLNDPKPVKTTLKKCDTTQNNLNFEIGEIWNFLLALVFQISGPNAQT